MEDAERQAGAIEGKLERKVAEPEKKEVNRVFNKKGGGQRKSTKFGGQKTTCYRCGLEGHKASDKGCTAWGETCRKCKGKDHFERVCRSKPKKDDSKPVERSKPKHVRQVESEVDDKYAFTVRDATDASSAARITVNIGGIPVEMIIDSGASCNIIDQSMWEMLKAKHIQCVSTKCKTNLYAYGSNKSLPVIGKFTAQVVLDQTVLDNVEFIVIEGRGQPLLGRVTALALKVLRLGREEINTVQKGSNPQGQTETDIFAKYPDCCKGLGKLKDYQLKIPIDANVEPVARPMRRVPYHLRDKLGKKLDELVALDIIEEVSGLYIALGFHQS